MTKVAAIIPALNEAKTIGNVLSVVKQSPLINEIIVVSDGSTDGTCDVVGGFDIRCVEHEVNQGKGQAMTTGVENTDAEVIIFFDADLKNLTVDHIELLLKPVLDGETAMNVGLRDRGDLIFLLYRFLPLISGERAMRREVFEGVPVEFRNCFMIEGSLNYYCQINKLPIGRVNLEGLTIRRKMEKVGFVLGLWQYVKMSSQIAWVRIVVRVARLRGRF